MIPLRVPAVSDAAMPFVTRLKRSGPGRPEDSLLVDEDRDGAAFSGDHGLFVLDALSGGDFDDDVVLVDPGRGRVERLIRASSVHNSLLVTERCDQLCVMCSQPPKKSHVDRFSLFEQACRLAPGGAVIGISGGEPTLYKEQLLDLVERTHDVRPDVSFHILSNGQHFEREDVRRLRSKAFCAVTWGIPLYAAEAALHDKIVGKLGAFDRLHESFARLIEAGARIELRTVLLQSNARHLPELATYVMHRLRFIHVWSIMQLEHIGFARNRWNDLYFDHASDFAPVATAIDTMLSHDLAVRLFNFTRCSVPGAYRRFAAASISDWKRKYLPGCKSCREQAQCTGFFDWHPADHPSARVHAL